MDAETLAARFNLLSGRTRKVIPVNGHSRRNPEDLLPEPDPAADLAAEMHDWATRKDADAALKWIEDRIVEANTQAHATAGTPQSAYWLGCEAGLRAVRDEMNRWRGEPAGKPPARPA